MWGESTAINQNELILKVSVRVNNEFNFGCTMIAILVK